jgi:hypothetical protein
MQESNIQGEKLPERASRGSQPKPYQSTFCSSRGCRHWWITGQMAQNMADEGVRYRGADHGEHEIYGAVIRLESGRQEESASVGDLKSHHRLYG